MKRLPWLLLRRGDTLALGVGVLLVAAALLLDQALVRPLAAQVEALQAGREGTRERRAGRQDDALDGPASPQAQIAAFHAHFAQDAPLTERMVRLHRIARKLGLELEQAEYRLTSQPGSRLDRYQMVLPLAAPYPRVRAFVGAVLREMPTLSLDAIRLQRPDVAEGTAQVQITFTFFVAR